MTTWWMLRAARRASVRFGVSMTPIVWPAARAFRVPVAVTRVSASVASASRSSEKRIFAALTPLLPQLADDLELSKAEAGALAGAYAFGALGGGLPGGLAAARLGVKPTVLLGLPGMTATTLTFGFPD